jgi:hypothetical protein
MKGLAVGFVGAIVFFLFAPCVNASLLVVDRHGEIVWNVLSEEDSLDLNIPKHSLIKIKEINNVESNADSMVSLTNSGGSLALTVSSGSEIRELDVSGWNDDLVEIEERAEVQRIVIGVINNLFSLEQKGIRALTEFPIDVDTKRAELSVRTSSGDKCLSVLPFQAVETLLRSKILNKVTGNEIRIVESDQDLHYLVKGERTFEVFNIFSYSVPVTSGVSVATGEVLFFDAPVWYKAAVFLFT